MATKSPGPGGPVRKMTARGNDEITAATGGGELREQFRATVDIALQSPDDQQAWERLEQMGRLLHRVDEVAAVYRSVMQRALDPAVAMSVGARAVSFHDEWIDNKAAVVDILQRILDIDPGARWAFDRMSLHLTAVGRWEDLLALYDRAIEAAAEPSHKMALLEEAAQLAKDCAGQTERAIRYLEQIFAARPQDAQNASALERLLRQQHRHRELIDFWTARLPVLADRDALQTRLQIATCWLDNLHDPAGALETLKPLLEDESSSAAACTLLERIVASSSATRDVRARAMELLGARYDHTERWVDVVRALERALTFAQREECLEIHSEIVQRLVEHEKHAEAQDHLAALVALDAGLWNEAMLDRVLSGEFDEVVAGCRPRIGREEGRYLLHRAAAIAANDLADKDRAITLYRRLLEDSPNDLDAVSRLVVLYQESGRLGDLLALRRHELGLATQIPKRLALRLEIAQLLEATGDHLGAVTVLRENLQESPDHEATIGALISALEQQGHHAELGQLLRDQAARVEALGRRDLAAGLWQKAAQIAEVHLRDTLEAVACYKRVVELAPNVDALDALARISVDRGQHASAVEWLEKRLALTDPGKRTPTIAKLAKAHAGAGQQARALRCLQQGIEEDPGSLELRRLAADLHRQSSNWTELVRVLRDGAALVDDPSVRFELLVEAAEAYQWELDQPADAVAVLEQAVAIRPADQAVRTSLADALRAAGRYDEALALAESIVEEYGRRRPPERAALHLLLAQVLHAQGQRGEAIRQLELAASMDVANPRVQHMLGITYRETGQLDRAERAFHALLLILRRQRARSDVKPGRSAIGIAETLFALHRVALDLGAADRAAENLASAFDTAAQDEWEARRLLGILRDAGSFDLLLRALEQRLARAERGKARASILSEMAEVLETSLAQPAQAFECALQAVAEQPSSADLRASAQRLARRVSAVDRWAHELESLAASALAEGDAATGCDLLLCLGELRESDGPSLEDAAVCYARAEDTGERLVDVWRAMARVAGRRGDRETQLRALRKLVDSGIDDLPDRDRAETLFSLAEIELASAEDITAGLATIDLALAADPSFGRAARALRVAMDVAPDDERVVSALERVARSAGDSMLLLDALEHRLHLGTATQAMAREAVDLATHLNQPDRASSILSRAVDLARIEMGDAATALWALRLLAARARQANDVRAAVQWMSEAAEVADPDEARQLWLDVAALSADQLGDLQIAVDTYERLLELDPSDPAVWRPMLEAVRRTGDTRRLEKMLSTAAEAVFDAQERSNLRLEHARLVVADAARTDEAIGLLRVILDDDPDHPEAAAWLADLLDRTGRHEDLAALLRRRLDGARDHQDVDGAVACALRLGALPLANQRQVALDAYRFVLEWVPDQTDILRAMLPLLDPVDDAGERAETLERLIATQGDPHAIDHCLELVALRRELGDQQDLERALDRAWHVAPEHPQVRAELRNLADDMVRTADSQPQDAVSCLLRAAAILKDRLGDPAAAASAVLRARSLRPADLGLLDLLVDCQLASGLLDEALTHTSAAMQSMRGPVSDRIAVHRLRARVLTACNRHDEAVGELDEAMALGDANAAADLYQALVKSREAAAENGDRDAERAATLRLSDVLLGMGESDRARNVLGRWIASEPDDVIAIRKLLALDREAGRWREVIDACARLVAIETGPGQVDAVLQLADACAADGRPRDAQQHLEHVLHAMPEEARVRARLRALYEAVDARRELSNLLITEANLCADESKRFDLLREAGKLRLGDADQAAAAIGPLSEALEIRPDDVEVTLLLADAYLGAGLIEEAVQLLRAAIDRQGGKRSRELASLQHRMARAASFTDRTNELSWLAAAFETYPQNGDVAAELAELATEMGHFDVALKALRSIATMKIAAPISRPMAFLKQARIAHLQGDDRKAVFLAKKALSEDASFAEAQEFIRSLGG